MSIDNYIEIENTVNVSMKVLNEFNWLIDSYVLDFYTEDHWNRLPFVWKSTLEKLEPDMLTDLFKSKTSTVPDRIVWPLSLLCLRKLTHDLIISRDSQNIFEKYKLQPEPLCYFHPKLKNLFKKRVKPKKRHEIERMAALCSSTATDCNVKYIIDFGAGLGHLSRVLGYGYGLNVCCLEQQTELTEQARIIDDHVERTAKKLLDFDNVNKMRRPVHLNITLAEDTNIDTLIDDICESFGILNNEKESFAFGIVGLHPCGDLAAMLLNVFLNCEQAKFLNIVGCCYMKMTNSSFPLSICLKNRQAHLSYEAKEIACHAQEIYVQQLAEKSYGYLKVHSYRAALEKIICKHWPCLRRSGLKSIKHSQELSFLDYSTRATSHLNIEIPVNDIFSADVKNDLNCWKKVVTFYTLRLFLAPLVESVILADRMLCIFERKCTVKLEALFDPHISPRNHVMTARKNN